MKIKIDHKKVQLKEDDEGNESNLDHGKFDHLKFDYIKFDSCEDIGFEHFWENSYYSNETKSMRRKCINCGKKSE